LVQIRGYARSEPKRPAHEVIEPLLLAELAERSGRAPVTMTFGSDLGWKSHAWVAIWRVPRMVPPFWRTIWKGWLCLQTLHEGVHLAVHLRLKYVGKNQG
jgi:hypothetical protein